MVDQSPKRIPSAGRNEATGENVQTGIVRAGNGNLVIPFVLEEKMILEDFGPAPLRPVGGELVAELAEQRNAFSVEYDAWLQLAEFGSECV